MNDENTIPVTFDANESLWGKYKKHCDDNDMKYGPRLNRIIKDYLKAEGVIKCE